MVGHVHNQVLTKQEHICILCSTYANCTNIGELQHDERNGSDIFYYCTHKKLKELDHLDFCETCISNLIECYEFIKKCDTLSPVYIDNEILPQDNLETNIKVELDESEENGAEESFFAENNRSNDEFQTVYVKSEYLITPITENDKEIEPSAKLEGKLLQCDICNKTYTNKRSLRIHKYLHTGKFKCNSCNKSFSTKLQLQNHERTHTNEKPFECDVCSKTFTQKGHLQIHRHKHNEEKPFKCPDCDKTFAHKSILQDHLRVHAGKPFQCEVCGKTFLKRSNLQAHSRTHTGEKPFECEFCARTFQRNDNLQVHILRAHNEDRPFKCDYCDKAFPLKASLQFHVRTHTGEKPHKCNICDMTFAQRPNLLRHLRTHGNPIL